MGFFKKLANALSSKKYRANPQAGALSVQQGAALNVGAINAEQTACFCNSLETGRDKKDTQNDLRNYYDIVDRTSALETLEWLRDRGHSVYFDAICDFCAERAARIEDSSLSDAEKPNTYEYIRNLQAAIPDLMQGGFIRDKGEMARGGARAWDMGRLVLVARCCADLGYLSPEEAWQFVLHAYASCKSVYHSWEDLAAGYLLGRAMFGGPGVMLNGIMGIAKGLLQDEESPWKNISFRS